MGRDLTGYILTSPGAPAAPPPQGRPSGRRSSIETRCQQGWCFSMLARYHPKVWTALLDVDESVDAVSIETALRTAQLVVPRLLMEELLVAAAPGASSAQWPGPD